MAMYGVNLFLPLILSGAGLSNSQVGFAATIPLSLPRLARCCVGGKLRPDE